MSELSEAQRWKQKYYDSLDALDNLEKRQQAWGELEILLKKTVTRLGLAAMGHDDGIDGYVERVRNATKEDINRPALEDILENFSTYLATLQDSKKVKPVTPVSLAQSFVKDLDVPAALHGRKMLLADKLMRGSLSESDELIREFSELFYLAVDSGNGSVKNSTAERSDSVGSSPGVKGDNPAQTALPVTQKPGLWQRLLKRYSGKGQEKDLSGSPGNLLQGQSNADGMIEKTGLSNKDRDKGRDKPGQHRHVAGAVSPPEDVSGAADALVDPSARREDGSRGGTPVVPTARPANEVLLDLLEKLSVPADQQAEVNQIKLRLATQIAAGEWRDLLQQIVNLINSVRNSLNQEKREFELFLQQITQRLQEIGGVINAEQLAQQDALRASEQFSTKVTSNVEGMRKNVSQAQDLAGLKLMVEANLNTLSKDVIEYRETDRQRALSAERNMAEMRERMASMEKSAVELKTEVEASNRKALVDALTNIPNRLSLEGRAQQEIARWQEFGSPLTLIVWDIDHFKRVNDAYGHAVGDKALQAVAQLLNENSRQSDFLARYGGEEFVMLLPGTGEDEALKVANALRERVATRGFQYRDEAVSIQVSCGISCFRDGDDLATVFDRADRALYNAKEAGRNRCVIG